MSPQLIIQPAGNQGSRDHYRDTVAQPVPLDRIARHVDQAVADRLREVFPTGSAAVWGVTPGGRSVNAVKWERISEGDVAVFLQDKRATTYGLVAVKARSASLGGDLWGRDEDGETWEYVYFLKDVKQIDIPYSELNAMLGYEPGNNFMAFNVLPPDQSHEAISRIISIAPVVASRTWWVNQGQFYREQRDGRFIWAPKTDKRGNTREPYSNVGRMRPGDHIYHYDSGIRAVGRVLRAAYDAPRPPEFGTDQWNSDGLRADVEYRELPKPIALPMIPEGWRTTEASTFVEGPFQSGGGVKLGFLYPLRDQFVRQMQERFPELADGGEDRVTTIRLGLLELASNAARDFRDAGLLFAEEDLSRFVAALLAKPFVILTGLSGSGKTKLAQGLAYWLGATPANDCCAVVAVGADWNSKDSVLGYANALNPAVYERTDALRLLLHARDNPGSPHFLILDEMNLSHVERYFADILSSMESGEPLRLHSAIEAVDAVPSKLWLFPNVFIVGTVNVDETTYTFSPKVLDRANVIEFLADRRRIADVISLGRRPALDDLADKGAEFADLARRKADIEPLPSSVARQLQEELTLLFDVLATDGLEFGYRVAAEVAEFLRMHRALTKGWTFEVGMDAQILQKILPRLHGSQRKLEGSLAALSHLCFEKRIWQSSQNPLLTNAKTLSETAIEISKQPATDIKRLNSLDAAAAQYPRSFTKLRRMLRHLDRNGFTSFAEA